MTELSQHEIDAETARLAALRMQLLEMHPFWGYMLLQVRLIAAPGLPSLMMTDCVSRIWFDPRQTRELDRRELGFVLMHEICHQVLASNERQQQREPRKWDYATDYAINDLVAEIPIPGAGSYSEDRYLYRMPPEGLYSRRYHNWIAETIYEDLCRRKDFAPEVRFFDLSLPDGSGKQLEFPGAVDFGGGIDLHLPCGPDEEQRALLRTRIGAAVDNFHGNADRGDIPGDLLLRLGLLGQPKLPWRRLLHQYADTVLRRDDYSLVFPNKRFLVQDLVVPGCYSERLGTLVAAVDTSGSMDPDEIHAALSELRGMVGSAEELTVIVADCRVHQVVSGDELDRFLDECVVAGGGGTDHRCVFEYIREHGPAPGLFVGLSDLYSTFPALRPPYPVVWLTPERHAVPPWGRVIEM